MVKENFTTERIKLEIYGSLFLPWKKKNSHFFLNNYIYKSNLYIFISYNTVFFPEYETK